MRDNERDPEGLLDEPMLMLRNQGQVLGAEQQGDFILASGRFEGNKLFADHVRVINVPSDTPRGFEGVVGEIMKRTENILTVEMAGVLRTVEVMEGAQIDIPAIPGENTVNQLRQHLEIQRMSKSKGNVVNPDELVDQFGTDTVRAYLMFAFDWEKGGPWDPDGIKGPARWISDVWDMVQAGPPNPGAGDPAVNRDVERKVHQAIDQVTRGLEGFSFNTAIAGLMTLRNQMQAFIKGGQVGAAVWHEAMRSMLLLMAPITPHMAEELWACIGEAYSIHQQPWPTYDADKAREDATTLVVQAGKKVVERISVPVDIAEEQARELALASEGVRRLLNGGEPKKVIFIAGRNGQEPKINIVI